MKSWTTGAFGLTVLCVSVSCGNNAGPTADDSCLGHIVVTPLPVELPVGDSILVTAFVDPCHDVSQVTFTLEDSSAAALHTRSDTSAMFVARRASETRMEAKGVPDGPILIVPVTIR